MIQIPTPPTPPTPPTVIVQGPDVLPPWVTLPPQVTLLIALGVLAACAVVLYPLMRALGRRIEGHGGSDPELRREVEQLRSRMGDLETLQHRVMELEERVDFAERLLAQRREPERLPGARSEP
jgi:Tfp pilus assembly protein PilO